MLPDPDFTQTCWPTIEKKLGRKMTADENKRFMYNGGGMFKEFFFRELEECATAEQAENLLARVLAPRVLSLPREPRRPQSFFSKLLRLIGL